MKEIYLVRYFPSRTGAESEMHIEAESAKEAKAIFCQTHYEESFFMAVPLAEQIERSNLWQARWKAEAEAKERKEQRERERAEAMGLTVEEYKRQKRHEAKIRATIRKIAEMEREVEEMKKYLEKLQQA